MATTFVTAPSRAIASPRLSPTRVGGGGSVTYYYRTSAGARGSTTDLGAIPALAVIERTVTA